MESKNMYQPNVVNMQPGPFPSQPVHKDYLPWSICNLVCCCLPLGIAALIFSIRTRDATHQNDGILAAKNSRITLYLNIASLVLGVILFIAIVVFYLVFFLNQK